MTKSELKQLAVFEGKNIRKILHEDEWWFSVIDVIEVLTGSDRPRKYWNDLKNKLDSEGYVEVSEKIGQLKMLAPDGKMRQTDCANTETMFRIIQSIPSPKVEPLKRWLAKVAKERIDEIMQGSFDLKVEDYKQVKGLGRENLRDHMTDIELILTMLGEATTTKLHRDRDSQGLEPLKKDAQEGGAVAGSTRRDIEKRSGKPVVTGENFKGLTENEKKGIA